MTILDIQVGTNDGSRTAKGLYRGRELTYESGWILALVDGSGVWGMSTLQHTATKIFSGGKYNACQGRDGLLLYDWENGAIYRSYNWQEFEEIARLDVFEAIKSDNSITISNQKVNMWYSQGRYYICASAEGVPSENDKDIKYFHYIYYSEDTKKWKQIDVGNKICIGIVEHGCDTIICLLDTDTLYTNEEADYITRKLTGGDPDKMQRETRGNTKTRYCKIDRVAEGVYVKTEQTGYTTNYGIVSLPTGSYSDTPEADIAEWFDYGSAVVSEKSVLTVCDGYIYGFQQTSTGIDVLRDDEMTKLQIGSWEKTKISIDSETGVILDADMDGEKELFLVYNNDTTLEVVDAETGARMVLESSYTSGYNEKLICRKF